MSHQEVVQSLAGQPRSGNCPRSLCRTLVRTSLASAPVQWPAAVTSGRAPGAPMGRGRRTGLCARMSHKNSQPFGDVSGTDSERDCNRDFCDLRHRNSACRRIRCCHIRSGSPEPWP